MNASPLVSLCIPTYNGARHLDEALASIAAQTFDGDAEVVVSDSGSTDGTLDLIESWRPRLPFALRVLPERTRGMVANWNAVTRAAAGTFVKYVFQDDRIAPDCVAEMVRLATDSPDVSFVFCRRHVAYHDEPKGPAVDAATVDRIRYIVDHHPRLPCFDGGREVVDGAEMLRQPALFGRAWNPVGEPTAVLFRRALLDRESGFDAGLCQLVDVEFWFRLIRHGRVGYLDRPLAEFRVHAAQMTMQNHASAAANLLDHERFIAAMRQPAMWRRLHPRVRAQLWLEHVKIRAGRAGPRATLADRAVLRVAGSTKVELLRRRLLG